MDSNAGGEILHLRYENNITMIFITVGYRLVGDIKGYWMLYLPVVFAVIAGFSLDPIATISCSSTDAYAWNG